MNEPTETTEVVDKLAGTERTEKSEVKRFIGIRPRVKMKVGGEPSPTQVVINSATDGLEVKYELATEQDELDFVRGKWPKNGKFRDTREGEDLSVFLPHHIIRDDPKKAEKEERPIKPNQVPVCYEGFKRYDLGAMSLGGIGDYLAYAISRFGEKGGFAVKRIPPFRLKDSRGEDANNDAKVLATLIKEKPELFRDVAERDRALITLRETTRLRRFVQDDRKACFQRVRTSLIGQIFCSEEGGYKEGGIEKLFDLAIASDPVAVALQEKEKRLNKRVEKACEALPFYREVLAKVKGLGPQISAPIVGAVQDIGLFDTVGKFKAFCGLHILGDGRFPRKRRGERCNWNPSARQAFFLLGDMFNKFPDGFWGQRLRENKVMYRKAHPYPVLRYEEGGAAKQIELVDGLWRKDPKRGYIVKLPDIAETTNHELIIPSGKQDYTKAHIHKMAVWRTVSEFAEWLYWRWRTMEGYQARPPKVFPPEDKEVAEAAWVLWYKTHPKGEAVVQAPESVEEIRAVA